MDGGTSATLVPLTDSLNDGNAQVRACLPSAPFAWHAFDKGDVAVNAALTTHAPWARPQRNTAGSVRRSRFTTGPRHQQLRH